MSGWISGKSVITVRSTFHNLFFQLSQPSLSSHRFPPRLFVLTLRHLTLSLIDLHLPYAGSIGFVMLPPGAIKDAEGVGECSQVFFVSECQDGAGEHPRIRSSLGCMRQSVIHALCICDSLTQDLESTCFYFSKVPPGLLKRHTVENFTAQIHLKSV